MWGNRIIISVVYFFSAKSEDEADLPLKNTHESETGTKFLKSHVANDAKPKDAVNNVSSKVVIDIIPQKSINKDSQSQNSAANCETPFMLAPPVGSSFSLSEKKQAKPTAIPRTALDIVNSDRKLNEPLEQKDSLLHELEKDISRYVDVLR